MGEWINFKELRSRLEFKKVLDHYGVELSVKGNQATGPCPLPTHGGDKGSSSFSANLERGIWQCFKCKARGNVLDFAVRMEGKLPDNAADIRAVAIGLQEWLGLKGAKPAPRSSGASSPKGGGRRARSDAHQTLLVEPPAPSPAPPPKDVRINEPLDFELKGLEPEHPYLRSRGFTAQTIWRFGLGFCARGLMAGRVAIPLRNTEGRLVGYAGRLVDDSKVSEANPKYKFPSRRERDGVAYEFHKSHILYNADRIKEPVDHLVVVEGFRSVWWIDQAGIPNVVATMGSCCSKEQAAIIFAKTTATGRITVLPDGDEAGGRFRQSVFEAVGVQRWTRWVDLPSSKQPTDCDSAFFSRLSGV